MASRIRRHLALLACAFIWLGAYTEDARALETAGVRVSPEVRRAIGDGATLTSDGLYRVPAEEGAALLTHGPDPSPALLSPATPARAVSNEVGFGSDGAQRPPICAAADAQQVLYARPVGAADGIDSARADIRAAIKRTNAVLNQESLASGGPTADYRVRCDDTSQIDVQGFVSSGTSFAQIVSSAREAGFDSNLFDYAIFVDGSAGGSCGIASYRPDEALTADNLNNFGGGYAVIYRACWNSETPMHEIGHTMGAVQYGAPNSTGSGGHCYDEDDVMCYSPDGGDLHQDGTVRSCDSWLQPRFDCNYDDYFDSAPEQGEYLDSHWNLGSPLNAFVAFDGAALLAKPAAPRRTWRIRDFRVHRHTRRLEISIRAATGSTLYVSRGHRPTERRFACRSRARRHHASCRIRRPQRGRWVIGVLRPATSGVQLRIKQQTKRSGRDG